MSLSTIIESKNASGLFLIFMATLAIIFANTELSIFYNQLLLTPAEIAIGTFSINKPLLLWINDGLMAIFFFLVGLEIKREFVVGDLNNYKQALLPGLGAFGGMLCPAIIFSIINWQYDEYINGWAIPAATDIAFALCVLSLLGDKVHVSLKIMLTAIAVIDDLGAIVIIALFYTSSLSMTSLIGAITAISFLVLLNKLKVRNVLSYLFVGAFLWVFVLKSGVHATLSGVILAFFIPIDPYNKEESILEKMEHDLHPWVAWAVLPIFGFANAGVSFEGMSLSSFYEPLTLGIILGLFLGNQIGIFSSIWLGVKFKLFNLPNDVNWIQIYGLSLLCGIGFTMSLFIGSLAYEDSEIYAAQIRLGVLAGSIISAVLGFMVLKRSLK